MFWRVISYAAYVPGALRWLRFNANQQSGSSYVLFLLKHKSEEVYCMHKASFISSSIVWLACCRILVPL